MGNTLHDISFGLRMLRKSPLFTLTAVLSLAFSIGINTTIFSFVNAILLRPLPFSDPARVMSVFTTDARHQVGPHESSYPDFVYFRENNEVFSQLSAHIHYPMGLSTNGQTQQVLGELVSGNYFDMLGVKPALGRAFLPAEDQTPLAAPVAVISYDLWRGRFGSDPNIVGKTVVLTGHAYNVVGVAPREFKGMLTGLATEVWVPMMMQQWVSAGGDKLSDTHSHWLYVTGRLKPGVSPEQAQAAMSVLARRLEQTDPDAHQGFGQVVTPKDQSRLFPGLQRPTTIFFGLLMGVVSLVLLIACANVANMLLARSLARRREMAVRLALGASRRRLIRQLLTESLLLSLLSGGVGLLLAYWSTSLIGAIRLPTPVPIALDLSPDSRVLVFTLVVAVLTGLVFGLTPALQASRQDLTTVLKGESAVIKGTRRRFSLHGTLLVAQVAISFVLLVGSGLFIRSLVNAQKIDPGIDTDNVLGAAINVELEAYDETRGREFFRQLTQRVAALPGVQSVSISNFLPLGTSHQQIDVYTGEDVQGGGAHNVGVDFNVVGTDHFNTLGIPLLRGRDFTDRDRAGSQNVAIINETMAKRFWPGQEPIGKVFRFGGTGGWPVEVVGVVKDGKYRSLGEEPLPFMYVPYLQNYRSFMTVLVRTTGDPKNIAGNLREEVRALAPDMPVLSIKTLREYISISLLPAQFGATILGVFGVLAVILVALGLYGGIAYYVNQHRREIGIRMALGARPGHILRHVVGRAMILVGVGVVFGLLLAFAFGSIVGSLLYGISGTDAVTYAGVLALLLGVSALASLMPVRQALRLNPVGTLRCE
jgi:macrolide transport system ATP-binding/permease protein